MRWMRPRGESISSLQRTYVGHVGRQNPQWTQSSTYSRITRRGLPDGSSCRADRIERGHDSRLRPARLIRPPRSWRRSSANCLYSMRSRVYAIPGGRTMPAPRLASGSSSPGAKRSAAARGSLALPRLVPDRRVGLRAADKLLGPSRAAPHRTLRSLEEHGHATGVEDVERARLELRCEKSRRPRRPRRPSRRRASRVAFGSGCRRKLARAMRASRPSDPQTRRARS